MNRSRLISLIGAVIVVGGALGAATVINRGAAADEDTSATGARIDSIAQGLGDGSGAQANDMDVPVEGEAAILDTMVLSVTAAGQAAAWRQASVSALVQGELKTLSVRENEQVSAGGLLAAIDPAMFEIELREAEARLRQVEAQYRTETLFDERLDASVRTERQQTARAKTGLDAAELAVEKARLNLSRARLTSPFRARVASVKAVPGQWIKTGDELLTLVDIERVKVEVQVLESEISLLTPGRSARISFAAFPGQEFVGRIETINPIVDKETRSAKVVVSLPNPEDRILPGMYARVALDARRLPDRIMIPRSAVLERDNPRRKLVFVFEGEGTRGMAKWRYVKTGAENERWVEIIADPDDPDANEIRPGEVVLTAGHHTLVHDARIRIVQNAQAEGGRPR